MTELLSLILSNFDGPVINTNNLKFVQISKELLKRAGHFSAVNDIAIPARRDTKNQFKKDYDEIKA